MASSSSQRSATRASPPPEQLASFYKLVDKEVIAGVLCREARGAELSAQAAVQAEALFGGDSLVVASLRNCESVALANLACEASGAEQQALMRKSWNVLISVIRLLLRRLEAHTLLPGTLREEELDYEAHVQAAAKKAKNKPVSLLTHLREVASTLGYNTLLEAMVRSLDVLAVSVLPPVQKKSLESFVLQGLDIISRTAGIPGDFIVGEKHLVAFIGKHRSPRDYEPAFCAAVLRK